LLTFSLLSARNDQRDNDRAVDFVPGKKHYVVNRLPPLAGGDAGD
jgi:hypothetical protein